MKAILEYNLPEEQSEYELALSAGKLHKVAWEFTYTVLRKALKYEVSDNEGLQALLQTHPEVTRQVLETINKIYADLLDENKIAL